LADESEERAPSIHFEGSLVFPRLYYDLIDEIEKVRRERKGFIYTTVRLLDPLSSEPVKSTPSGRAS
jgi:hypothetical protein